MTSRTAVVLIAGAFAVLAATAASARERYFAYEPDSDAARYRSGDITVTLRVGLMGATAVKLYRERGADLGLAKPGGQFSQHDAERAIGEGGELQLFAVDAKDGEGFAHGACKGAARAWIAFRSIHAYEPLRIYVLKYDDAAKAPELCETLDYRWRGEFRLPSQNAGLAEPGPQ